MLQNLSKTTFQQHGEVDIDSGGGENLQTPGGTIHFYSFPPLPKSATKGMEMLANPYKPCGKLTFITGDGNKRAPLITPPLRLDSWLAKLVQILKIFKVFPLGRAGRAGSGPDPGLSRSRGGRLLFPSPVIAKKSITTIPNSPQTDD